MQKKRVRETGLVGFGKREMAQVGRSQCLRLKGRKEPAILEDVKDQKGGAVINNTVRMGCRLALYLICFFVEIRISFFILG